MNKLHAVVLLVCGLTRSALPHDTWLIADQMKVAPKTTVTLDLTSGMAFPTLEVGPKRERVEAAKYRLNQRTFDINDLSTGEKSLRLTTEFASEGIATLWVKLPPRQIELKPDEVTEYLDEVSASESLRKQWS